MPWPLISCPRTPWTSSGSPVSGTSWDPTCCPGPTTRPSPSSIPPRARRSVGVRIGTRRGRRPGRPPRCRGLRRRALAGPAPGREGAPTPPPSPTSSPSMPASLAELDTLDAGIQKTFTTFYMNLGGGDDPLLRRMAHQAPRLDPEPSTKPGRLLQREPLGVCGMFVPWNGPPSRPPSPVPALAAGNSIVFKPAEQTPISALFIGRLFAEATSCRGCPCRDPGRRLDGRLPWSTTRGRQDLLHRLGRDAGSASRRQPPPRLKRVDLESAGRARNIVFADADLEAAAAAAALGGSGTTRARCARPGTRVLVSSGSFTTTCVAAVVERSRRRSASAGPLTRPRRWAR